MGSRKEAASKDSAFLTSGAPTPEGGRAAVQLESLLRARLSPPDQHFGPGDDDVRAEVFLRSGMQHWGTPIRPVQPLPVLFSVAAIHFRRGLS